MLLLLLLANTCLHAISICPKMLFYFCKNNFENNLKFYSGLYKIDLFKLWLHHLRLFPHFVDQNPGHSTRNLGVWPRLLHSLSSSSARGTRDRTWVKDKLQQFFYTLSVSQDFSLFLDLTYFSMLHQ